MGKDAWKVTDVFMLRIRLSNISYNPSTNVCQFGTSDLNLLTKETDPFSHLIDFTPKNCLLVLCDVSSYHDSYRFRPEDVQILSIESVK